MANSLIILAKVEDSQHKKHIFIPINCSFEEHIDGTAVQKAKNIAMPLLNSKPTFTHVTFEAMQDIELEDAIKVRLKMNSAAIIQQKVYNPLQAEFRGYSELLVNGFVIRYTMKTSAFCSYAVVRSPSESDEVCDNLLKEVS